MARLAGIVPVLIVVGGGLAGCAEKAGTPGDTIPGVRHNEPVIFNDQRYLVSYRFDESVSAYSVAVARPGKALGDDDRADARQVAESTVSYYACPARMRAKLADGTEKLSKKTWHLQVKCA